MFLHDTLETDVVETYFYLLLNSVTGLCSLRHVTCSGEADRRLQDLRLSLWPPRIIPGNPCGPGNPGGPFDPGCPGGPGGPGSPLTTMLRPMVPGKPGGPERNSLVLDKPRWMKARETVSIVFHAKSEAKSSIDARKKCIHMAKTCSW